MDLTPTAAVRGTAHLSVEPDFADVYITVRQHAAATRNEALAGVAGKLDVLRRQIAELPGVTSCALPSPRCTQERHYDRSRDKYVDGDWVAVVGGVLRLGAAAATEGIASLMAGPGNVGHVHWGIDRDNPARRKVRIHAIAAARAAAEDFAVGVGMEVADLVSIADPGVTAPSQASAWAAPAALAGAASGTEVEVDPEPVEISATVEAVYVLRSR